MTIPFFRRFRLAEVEDTIDLLRQFGKERGALLEIGAGTGWQAKALCDAGFRVEAIDLPAGCDISNHAAHRVLPITDYNGVHIPFSDANFDMVYSSNVLEHVVELDALTSEMARVLRPDGIALHLLPNPQWRLLSLLTYYPAQAMDAVRYLRRRLGRASQSLRANAGGAPPSTAPLWRKAARRIVPPTHGAVGSPLSEIRRFSRAYWDRFFARTGWDVLYYANNGLAASGDYLLGAALPIAARRRIGRAIGGIAHVYIVRRAPGDAKRAE